MIWNAKHAKNVHKHIFLNPSMCQGQTTREEHPLENSPLSSIDDEYIRK